MQNRKRSFARGRWRKSQCKGALFGDYNVVPSTGLCWNPWDIFNAVPPLSSSTLLTNLFFCIHPSPSCFELFWTWARCPRKDSNKLFLKPIIFPDPSPLKCLFRFHELSAPFPCSSVKDLALSFRPLFIIAYFHVSPAGLQ